MQKKLLFICSLSLCACSGTIDHHKSPTQEFPDAWQQSQQGTTLTNEQAWWKEFKSPELDALITKALTHNHDLVSALSRLEESRHMAGSYNAQRLPSLSGKGQLHRNLLHPDGAEATKGTTTYAAGLLASWEIDLWGRVKNKALAAEYDVKQKEADLLYLQHSISAELTSIWLKLIAGREEHRLLQKQVSNEEIALELIEARFKQNITSSLDVLKQRQNLTSVKRSIPPVLQNNAITENRLRLLVGSYPSAILASNKTELPLLSLQPKRSLPSEVIAARPDVRRAWYAVLASDSHLAVAKANRLPALTLSADLTFASTKSSEVFKNWSSNLFAGLAGPLFDGGRLSSLQYAQEQRLKQRVSTYSKTVYAALSEVENAMIAEKYQSEFSQLVEQEIAQAREFLKQALSHYTKGLIDYLEVVRNRKTLYLLERSLITIKLQQLQARVALQRSLGANMSPKGL